VSSNITKDKLCGWKFLYHKGTGLYYAVHYTGLVLDATDFVASKGNTEMKHLNIYADMLYQSYKLEGALETVEVAV